jgi:hypothetical protein
VVKLSMQPTSRKLWLSPCQFSATKVQIFIQELVSVLGHLVKFTLPPLSRRPLWWKVSRSPPPLFARYHPSRLFSLFKSEVGAGWPLSVSGQLEDDLSRDHMDHCQRWIRFCLLEVEWALQQGPSDWWQLPWEK